MGPRAALGRVRRISCTPGLKPRSVQHVASRHADCALVTGREVSKLDAILNQFLFPVSYKISHTLECRQIFSVHKRISCTPGLKPRRVQHVASRHADCALVTGREVTKLDAILNQFLFPVSYKISHTLECRQIFLVHKTVMYS